MIGGHDLSALTPPRCRLVAELYMFFWAGKEEVCVPVMLDFIIDMS